MNELNLDWTAIVAERKIQEAIEAGEFDNLELAGKPLNLDDNPYETFEQRMMSKILKNAGALPDWIQMERDIVKEMDAIGPAKERGLRGIRFAKNVPSQERAATRLRADYLERVDFINTMILKYTMCAPPGAQKPFRRLNKKEELAALEAAIAEASRPA
jgi:hypothetical protein